MNPESSFWLALKRGMRGRGHLTRHTEAGAPGIPDVSYGCMGVNGWIELKVVPRWPAPGREASLGLRPEQAMWLAQRGAAGGHCWMFARFDCKGKGAGPRRYGLYFWTRLGPWSQKYNCEELEWRATKVWEKTVDWEEFAEIIGRE